MAEIPTPRSYSQILGDMVDAFLSRFGLNALKVGSPVLSMLEAAAQSDLRSSEDVFQMLSAISLDTASGAALDRIASDEDMVRIGDTAATGSVTITDSRYTKKATKIFQGLAAPTGGARYIYVADAAGWPTTGTGNAIYIGRGTPNYEGPLAYTSITNYGYYYAIELTGTTQNYHNQSESVILAQGGNRTISSGTTVRTPQGNYTQAVNFSTVYSATIPDGEVSIENVLCTAQQPGVVGNVAAGAISQFQNAPFTGATVTNPLPFSNGLAAEDDQTLRERIRSVRASRSKGTPLALQTGVIGLVSTEENKRVTAASVVTRKGDGTTIYIDDGTGYEEKTAGLDYEILQDSALGGELYFQLAAPKPIVKAFATSTFNAPFTLVSGATLAVKVGGTLSEHTFDASEFRSITDAAVYEVVASINGNENLTFAARTANNGSAVSIFAKTETNEDVEVVAPGTGYDANDYLGFSSGKVETLRLYKNDRLLSKDGSKAIITSNSTSQWTAISSPVTLTISVDGTPATTYTITDASFVNAGTGYTTASQTNSVSAWATVLNATVPGITATANGDSITLTSNKGASSSASIVIGGGSLVSSKMFETTAVYGSDNDYTLDRNTGQLKLTQALVAGDRLTAGTLYTRAFVESDIISRVDLGANTANLYFAVDGNATIVPVGINSTITLTITSSATNTTNVKRQTITASSAIFGNIKQGDWAILWDNALNASNRGVYRISTATSNAISIERDSTWTGTQTVSLTSNGMAIVRSSTPIQTLSITGNNWAASNLVTAINSQLKGVTATTYRTNRVRIYTNTYGIEGDIAFLAANSYGNSFKFTSGSYIQNLTSHVGSVAASKSRGTATFGLSKLSTATSSLLTLDTTGAWSDAAYRVLNVGGNVVWGQTTATDSTTRYSTNYGQAITPSQFVSLTSLPVNTGLTATGLQDDGLHFEASLDLGAEDTLSIVVDGDTASKNYTIPLYRSLKPAVSTAYGTTVTLVESAGDSLAKAFGTGFDFSDFALYMKARGISHPLSSPDKRVLWRFYRFGYAGTLARMAYVYPTAPSLPVAVSSDYSSTSGYLSVNVALPSGSRKSLTDIRNSTNVGIFSAGGNAITLVTGYAITNATRTTTDTTITVANYGATALGVGSTIFVQSNNANFPSGLKTVLSSSATTITYTDSISGAATATNIGTASVDVAEAKWTNAQVNDIITFTSTSGFPYTFTMRVGTVTTGVTGAIQAISGTLPSLPTGYTASTNVVFSQLSNAGGIYLYPLGSSLDIGSIATAVNGIASSPVSAKVLGTAAQTVTLATFEESGMSGDPYYYMNDGLNWVKSNTNPATVNDNYTFTMKVDASTALTGTGTDWTGEEVRIVPVTTAGLVRWLNSTAISGLFNVSGIVAADNGGKLQVSTSTMGAAGSVQVQGGTANSISIPVYGSATAPQGTTSASRPVLVKVRTSDIPGLNGGAWLSIQNTNLTAKSLSVNGSTVTILANGQVTVDGGSPVWGNAITAGSMTNAGWRVEKHGKFAAYIWNGVGTEPTAWTLTANAGPSLEGNWVRIVAGSLSSANAGFFRIVRSHQDVANDLHVFWVENEDAIEESATASKVHFLTFDSLIPGDRLSIGTNALGTGNRGDWNIASVDYDTSDQIFTISRSSGVAPDVVDPGVVLSAADAAKIQFSTGTPGKLYKRVYSVFPSTTTGYTDLFVSGAAYYSQISEAAGSIIHAEDKLGFDTELHTGIDGYNYNTGLIQEASRVVYGDPTSPASYPGIAAAGANVYISGPLVKRIQVALALRVRSGVASGETVQLAKSAVASVINASPLGQPIAISDIVAAVNILDGVQAVSVISPTYNSGNDLISVQPYEKPLVQNLDQDVLVSLVGD